MVKDVTVYVCPTPGCSNYYGSSSMGPIEEQVVGQKDANFGPKPKTMWHTRAECPDCRGRGVRVQRVPITVKAVVGAVKQHAA